MKKLQKPLLFILLIIFLYTSSSYSMERKEDICVNKLFVVESKIENKENEFFKYNIKYPFMNFKEEYAKKNKKNVKIIDEINKDIYEYIMSFKENISKQSEKYKEDYTNIYAKEKEKYVKYQYEADSDYQVTYNKNNIISIPITTYEFTGGAHGMTYLKSFNYNLNNGSKLMLKDLFKEDIDYEKIINNFIKSEISKNKLLYFTGKDGFKGIKRDQDFYLEDDGIVVYFQLYDIAPYYVGIPKFKLTYNQFGDYLK
ncbi:DUF3298 and DUF4163 domain-containing protein [Romboutsia sp. CE17]|uniref:DUF3298 and DUF4163 domain-containing protein n=1 Tax=Romboutsia sp. CE17 TaxID=2724150 RepID=UPI001442C9BF|nr:DUF3298 and DUF4163 domain-containing protein [Romboutsia sp. CE17]QJA08322.1 DUF3298 and DUF4163 domain-containing protein [Romboutsia sp. CE17]